MVKSFRQATEENQPLQVLGAINAYSAILAERAGAKALYVSGAGIANASFGLPDLGMTTLNNVCEDVRRIAGATDLPILVDADTGWDDPGVSITALEAAGASACHLEDQVSSKRCGHRPNKQLVTTSEMEERLLHALAGRKSEQFVVMARTDAAAVEGLGPAITRAQAYADAGAEMIFAEALTKLEDFRTFAREVPVPVLANLTEFGQTPLFTLDEMHAAGIRLTLYPLSAFRAMSQSALTVYKEILERGTQADVIDQMQSRDDLYDHLDYHAAETAVDRESQTG